MAKGSFNAENLTLLQPTHLHTKLFLYYDKHTKQYITFVLLQVFIMTPQLDMMMVLLYYLHLRLKQKC